MRHYQKKKIFKALFNSENRTVSKDILNNKEIKYVDKSWRSKIKIFLLLPNHERIISFQDIIYESVISKISVKTNKVTNITTLGINSVNLK